MCPVDEGKSVSFSRDRAYTSHVDSSMSFTVLANELNSVETAYQVSSPQLSATHPKTYIMASI